MKSLHAAIRPLGLSVLLFFIVGLTACGAPSTVADTPGSTPAAEAPGVGSDEPNIGYSDTTNNFSFNHPRSWTNTTVAGETIRFTGRDEFISVTVVQSSLSPMDYANQDHTALVSASPGFTGHAPVLVQIKAGASAMVAYQWNAGPSSVTGKLVPSSANRLYIPGPHGKLAIYTYSAPSQVYDPAGASDFVNMFGWR